MEKIPQIAANAVSVQSEKMPSDAVQVKGYDFNQGFDFHKLMQSYKTTGFQATNFGKAIEEINKMVTFSFTFSQGLLFHADQFGNNCKLAKFICWSDRTVA